MIDGSNEREAKVIITADTKKYTDSVKETTKETEKLNKGLAETAEKLDGIIKRSGKKLVLLGGVSAAGLTGATTAAATLQKQLSTLEAQYAALGSSSEAAGEKSAKQFADAAQSVRDLSREIPRSRGEIAQLTTAIAGMGIAPQQQAGMTRAFSDLGAATGESPAMLAQQTIDLQRQMGMANRSVALTEKANNATTMLGAQSGVSETQMLGFASNLAPTASIAGLSENEVKGVSTAFIRAGADGTRSANIFNKLANDITYMKESGSKDLDKYASALGMSRDEIESASPVDILNELSKQAQDPERGQSVLRYLGFDSIRAQKALQGLQSAGGVDKWIGVAEDAPEDATQKARDKAFEGLFDEMEVLRNKFTDLITAIGDPLLGPLTKLAEMFGGLVSIVEPFFNVIGNVIGAGGGMGALGLIGGGMALKAWAGVSTPALARRAVSSTFVQSARAGFAHGGYSAAGLARPDDMIARSIAMPVGTPGAIGRFNRGVYGAASRFGTLFPRDEGGLVRGNPFKTFANMTMLGTSALLNSPNFGMPAMQTHYRQAGMVNATDRKGAGQPGAQNTGGRGIWGNLRSGFQLGVRQTILGPDPGQPGGAARGPASSIADHKAKMKPMDKIFASVKAKTSDIMSYLNKSWKGTTQSLTTMMKESSRSLKNGFYVATKATYDFARALAIASGNTAAAARLQQAATAAQANAIRGWQAASRGFDTAASNASKIGSDVKDGYQRRMGTIDGRAAFNNAGANAERANTAATTQNTRSKIAEMRQTARTTSSKEIFRRTVTRTGASFAKLAASATRTALALGAIGVGGLARGGVSMIGAAGRGLGSLAGGLLGVTSVGGGLALAGGVAAAYAGYKSFTEGNQTEELLAEFGNAVSQNESGLKAYNDALGKGTVALEGFAAAADKEATTMAEATDLRRAQKAAQNEKEYTNDIFKGLTERQAKNFVGTMTNVGVEQAEAIMADVVRKFGADSNIARELAAELASGDNDPYRITTDQTLQTGGLGVQAWNAVTGKGAQFGLDSRYDFEDVGWWTNAMTDLGFEQNAYMGENSPLRKQVESQLTAAAQNVDAKLKDYWSLDEEENDNINARVAVNEYMPLGLEALGKLQSREVQMERSGPMGWVLGNTVGKLIDYTPFLDDDPMATQNAQMTMTGIYRNLGLDELETKKAVGGMDLESFDWTTMGETDEERQKWFIQKLKDSGVKLDGIDLDDVDNFDDLRKQTVGRSTAVAQKDLMSMAQEEGTGTRAGMQITEASAALGELLTNDGQIVGAIQDAINNKEDPVKAIKARDAALDALGEISAGTATTAEKVSILTTLQAKQPEAAENFQAAIDKLMKDEERKNAGANQAVAFGSQLDLFSESMARFEAGDQSEEQLALVTASKDKVEESITSLYTVLKNYRKSRDREEEDFLQNRQWQQEDYDRQLMYGQEDFYRSRRHQTADFHRSMERQEEDHLLRMERMTEDFAKQMYDPYQRMMGQGSHSGGSLIHNMKRQEEVFRNQLDNLQKLRERGLSEDAIKQLSLADPSKAQQVNLWGRGSMITDEEIKELNKVVERRKGIAGEFLAEEGNTQTQRMEEDRARQIERATEDFNRGMRRSMRAYLRQLARSEEAYLRSLRRADIQREKSLTRAKEDMLGFMEDQQMNISEQAGYVRRELKKMNNIVANDLADKVQTATEKLQEWSGIIRSGQTNTTTGTTAGGTRTGENEHGARRPPKRAMGGIAVHEQMAIIGDGGPEAVIPLNAHGAMFMAESLKQMYTNNKNMPIGDSAGAMQVYNNSTNFNGEIHIKANNPNEIANQLKHRKRMDALRGGKGTTVFS